MAPQAVAAERGRAVLARGGNAVDAAVTAAFVQCVIDPHMCGIGGCGAMVIYTAATDTTDVLEFYARAGSLVREDQWASSFIRETADRYGYRVEGYVNDVGYSSIGIPGTVAGLYEALNRFGTISWDQAIAPAISLAREGVRLPGFMRWDSGDAGADPDWTPHLQRIQTTSASAEVYTNSGSLWQLGDLLVQADYGRTLEIIARQGPDAFYRGEIAEVMAADLAINGASITRDDIANYKVRAPAPLRGTYRGRMLVTTPPPGGGMTLLQVLNFLEGFDFAKLGWPSSEAAALLIEAMRWAFRDRDLHLADAAFVEVPTERLLDKAYAEAAHAGLRLPPAGIPFRESAGTTHVSVLDQAGNAVSLTHTLGESSGVVTSGLGFPYNNYLNCFDPRPGRANSLAPGKARATMMCPTIITNRGRVEAVVGAPGGTKIVSAVAQVLVHLFDHDMRPTEAVNEARLDWQAEAVEVEARVPLSIVDSLRDLGLRVNQRMLSYDDYFGRPQVIARCSDGRLRGASDPRDDGGVALEA